MEFVVGYLVVVLGLTALILGGVLLLMTAAHFVAVAYLWYSIISMARKPETRFADLVVPCLVNAFLMFILFVVAFFNWQWFLASLILGVFMGFWIWFIYMDDKFMSNKSHKNKEKENGNLD